MALKGGERAGSLSASEFGMARFRERTPEGVVGFELRSEASLGPRLGTCPHVAYLLLRQRSEQTHG